VRRTRLQGPGSPGIANPKLRRRPIGQTFGVCWLEILICFCFVLSATAGANPESSNTSIAVEALSRLKGMDLESNPALKAAVLKVLDQVRGKPQFVEIVRDFQIKGQGRELMELAIRSPDDSAGVEAMRLVLLENDPECLKSGLASTNAPNLVKVLGNTGDKEIVPLLLPIVVDPAREAALRKSAVRGLARVENGAAALLDLAQEQKLPDDLKLTASSELNNVRWVPIKARAAELLPLPQGKNAEPLPAISELAKLKGDPARGAEVFRRETVGCNKCHQVNGEGIDFGPNLSEIGGKLGKDALYESILDPSAGISFGYEAWQVELKNGGEAFGLIVSETAEELVMKTVGGIVTRYRKADIVSRQKQKLSIMPAGLQQTMTKEEIVDLVEYLATLKAAKR